MKKVQALTFDEFIGVSGDGIGIPRQDGALFATYEFLFNCVSVKSATPMIAVEMVCPFFNEDIDLTDPNKDIIVRVGGYVTSGSGHAHPVPLYFKDDKFYSFGLDDLGMDLRRPRYLYEVDISNPDDFESLMDMSPEAIARRRRIQSKLIQRYPSWQIRPCFFRL